MEKKADGFRKKQWPACAGSVGWSCPSNIALVKYWGKREPQLPMNPSLSMTLEASRTSTRIRFGYDPRTAGPELTFRFESRSTPAFENRIRNTLDRLRPYLPWLNHTSLDIDSGNNFPHSSGIASSASAMGALALCLTEIERQISGNPADGTDLQKASFLARLGSGSACRSLYPEFALWGAIGEWEGSSDEFAIPVNRFHASFRQLKDTILIVESGQKLVSSSTGHAMMESHPFAEVRFRQARENLTILGKSLRDGDWAAFIALVEEEALTLHALMLSGKPGYLLMSPETISIIQKIRTFRAETGARLAFTLDAGANVHLLYDGMESDRIEPFIDSALAPHCENNRRIEDRMGKGPERL
ncbi:MAG: diphosphomevalonate/mevalonate 3,5-bisphosphate decarboxylase family protein [Bacteroidales bacterium]